MITAIFANRSTGLFILVTQLTKFLPCELRVDAAFIRVIIIVVIVIGIIIFVFEFFFRKLRADVCRRDRRFVDLVRINKTRNDVGKTHFFCFTLIPLIE